MNDALDPLIADCHPRDAHVLALRNLRMCYWFWFVNRNASAHRDMKAGARKWAAEARKALPAALSVLR